MSPPPKRQKRIVEVAAAQSNGNKKYKTNNRTRKIKMPKKKFYRQYTHANPFSDHHGLVMSNQPNSLKDARAVLC